MDSAPVGSKKKFYKRTWFWILIAVVVVVLLGSGGNNVSTSSTPVQQVSTTPSAPVLSKADAQKQLDDLIALAEKSSLVTSYEFSDRASVVYVTDVWYTQDVQFKKNFIAKVATLKKAINGFTRFEVRDYKSNELVGEMKYDSPEVYK